MSTPIISQAVQHKGVDYRVWLYTDNGRLYVASVKSGETATAGCAGNERGLEGFLRAGSYKLVFSDMSTLIPIDRLHVITAAAKLLQ